MPTPERALCPPSEIPSIDPSARSWPSTDLVRNGVGWPLRLAAVDRAWTITRGEGAAIAVVDDGVDVRHPAFSGRVPEASITIGAPERRVRRRAVHGTCCAGVACADDARAPGVAPGARLIPVAVPALAEGLGSDDEARAIDAAVGAGADVICCAWGPPAGGPGSAHPVPTPATREAIRRAARRGRSGLGAIVVWAAPNEVCDITLDAYASHPDVVAVAASNGDDRRCRYGAWGEALFCVFPSHDPELAEPGLRSIVTTAPVGHLTDGDAWYTERFGHTSAAAAAVAGLCALVVAANPALTRLQVVEVLRAACVKISPEDAAYGRRGHSLRYGHGRPDAFRAVRLAASLTSGEARMP